jgi:hypothetical protein
MMRSAGVSAMPLRPGNAWGRTSYLPAAALAASEGRIPVRNVCEASPQALPMALPIAEASSNASRGWPPRSSISGRLIVSTALPTALISRLFRPDTMFDVVHASTLSRSDGWYSTWASLATSIGLDRCRRASPPVPLALLQCQPCGCRSP